MKITENILEYRKQKIIINYGNIWNTKGMQKCKVFAMLGNYNTNKKHLQLKRGL